MRHPLMNLVNTTLSQKYGDPRPIERRLDWVFYKTEMKIWAVGCGLGWTVLKKVWADYEQLLREVFSTFCGQKKKKKKFENIVASALKSCIE